MTERPAVFLDRDGTIIEDVGYLDSLDGICFIPGAAEAVRAFKRRGFAVIVLTNQSGVARGFFTEEFVRRTHKRIGELLAAQGAVIDAFYYCPHHADGTVEKYSRQCPCRKPGTGMVEKAARDFGLDIKASYMVGDHYSDIGTGVNAGMRTVFVKTGHGMQEMGRHGEDAVQPAMVAADIREAARLILNDRGGFPFK